MNEHFAVNFAVVIRVHSASLDARAVGSGAGITFLSDTKAGGNQALRFGACESRYKHQLTIKSNSPLYTAVINAGAMDGFYKLNDSGRTRTRVSNVAVNATFIDGTTVNAKIAVGTSG